MSVLITNIVAQTAIKGQGVLVTCPSDVNSLDLVKKGAICVVQSSNKIGYVTHVDKVGGSFRIRTQYPFTDLSSSGVDGIFLEDEQIEIAE